MGLLRKYPFVSTWPLADLIPSTSTGEVASIYVSEIFKRSIYVNVTDSSVSVDSVSNFQTNPSSSVDSSSIIDACAGSVSSLVSLIDGSAVIDSSTIQKFSPVSVGDIGISTDSDIVAQSSAVINIDSSVCIDGSGVSQVSLVGTVDSFLATDANTSFQSNSVSALDSAVSSELIVATQLSTSSISDSTLASDSHVVSQSKLIAIVDSALSLDGHTILKSASVPIVDIAGTFDSDLTTSLSLLSVVDSTSAVDSMSVSQGSNLSQFDSAIITDGSLVALQLPFYPPLRFDGNDDAADEYPQPIKSNTEGLIAYGFYPQGSTGSDNSVGIERDGSGDLVLKDQYTSVVLSQLSKNSSFSELSSDFLGSSTAWTDLLSTSVVTLAGASVDCWSTIGFTGTAYFRILVDGAVKRGVLSSTSTSLLVRASGLSNGSHTITLQYKITSGTLQIRPVSQPDSEHCSLLARVG